MYICSMKHLLLILLSLLTINGISQKEYDNIFYKHERIFIIKDLLYAMPLRALYKTDTGTWFSYFNEYRVRTSKDQYFIKFKNLEDAYRFFISADSVWKTDSSKVIQTGSQKYEVSYGPRCLVFMSLDTDINGDKIIFSIRRYQIRRMLSCINITLYPPDKN